MSKQRIFFDDYDSERVHRGKRIKKIERIHALRALLEMHESNPDADHDYVLGLRARLRSAENQLQNMKL